MSKTLKSFSVVGVLLRNGKRYIGTVAAIFACSGALATDSNKVVIIKADDFRGPTAAWASFLEVSRAAHVKVSIGVIVDSVATNNSAVLWMKAQQDKGDVEFWDHGWDHARWQTNGETVQEFLGSGLAHQRAHLKQAQAALKAALGKDVLAFGPAYTGFDADTAAVINETPALRLLFCHKVTAARNLLTNRVVVLDFISEADGTGKPNGEKLEATLAKRMPGAVSLQFHPPYFDVPHLAEYQKIVNYLLPNGYSVQLPSEFISRTASAGNR